MLSDVCRELFLGGPSPCHGTCRSPAHPFLAQSLWDQAPSISSGVAGLEVKSQFVQWYKSSMERVTWNFPFGGPWEGQQELIKPLVISFPGWVVDWHVFRGEACKMRQIQTLATLVIWSLKQPLLAEEVQMLTEGHFLFFLAASQSKLFSTLYSVQPFVQGHTPSYHHFIYRFLLFQDIMTKKNKKTPNETKPNPN